MIRAIRPISVPRPVPALLGFIAGCVDICAFLGLFQIFVAQLTGSFVFASTWFIIHHGDLLMMLAIPTFFLAGCLATALAVERAPRGRPLVWVLGLECALLAAMLLVMTSAPLDNASAPGAVAAALVGVAAMGVQSAMVRLFMRSVPSTNVMTTNTTQLAVDVMLILLSLGQRSTDDDSGKQKREARERLGLYWPPMAGFVLGTAIGALCFQFIGKLAAGVPLASACALLIWCLRNPVQPANA
jgi:uncharacterized membrane protein YoaK (UPF0700 family)